MSGKVEVVRGTTWAFGFQVGSRSLVVGESGAATGSTAASLSDASASWAPDAFVGRLVRIMEGQGAGQVRRIRSNTATELEIYSGWKARPNASSTYNILEVMDIGGWDVAFTAKLLKDDTDENAAIGPLWFSLASDAETAQGRAVVTVGSDESATSPIGRLYYDIKLVDPGTSPSHTVVVVLDTLTVLREVTQAAGP